VSFPRRTAQPCAYCRVLFRPSRPGRIYCGRACAAKARPRASRVEAGRKGGLSRRKVQPDWVAIADLSPAAAFLLGRSVRKVWLANRLQSARRAGYSAGYEAACEACANLGWKTA
jgi:hypothetical protein